MSDAASQQPAWLWTLSGVSFGYREGDDLWTHDGRHVGRFRGEEIYGPDGRYRGELTGSGRLITARINPMRPRATFVPQPARVGVPRRPHAPGYLAPAGYGDFPSPEKLP